MKPFLALLLLLLLPAWAAGASLPAPYDRIEVVTYQRAVERLNATDPVQRDAAIREVERRAETYAPPALLALAGALWNRGQKERALFWFNAGRVRTLFDLRRCTDPSASGVLLELLAQTPAGLREAQRGDWSTLQQIVRLAVQWDEAAPQRYDHRWINLFGSEAFRASLGQGSAAPLSVPESEWPALARMNRLDYLQAVEQSARNGGDDPLAAPAGPGGTSAEARPRR